MTLRTASCCCGQLKAEVRAEPLRVGLCHCLACQARTGSVFGAQARFSREHVTITGRSTAYLRIGDAGSRIVFHFCPVCGSTVHYGAEGQDATIGIPVGAFGDPGFPPPSLSVYEERMHGWVHLPDGIEHMA